MLRFIIVFMVLTAHASAQSATLSGLVMDGSNGVPLKDATVTLQGAGLEATTDAEGRYSFENDASAKKASHAQVLFDGDVSKQNDDQVRLAARRGEGNDDESVGRFRSI